MSSAIKFSGYCLCLVFLTSGFVFGGNHDHNSMIEPLLVAGMVAMMLKKKKHGYSGRSPRHHHPPPPDVHAVHPVHRGHGPPIPGHIVQGHVPPAHQGHVVQAHSPQAHVVQEYAPSHGTRYAEESPQYQEENNESEVYPRTRYVIAQEQPPPEARYVIAQPVQQSQFAVSSTRQIPQSRFIQSHQRFIPKVYGR